MKLNKYLIIILFLVNVILLITIQQRSTRHRKFISTFQKSLLDIQIRNEEYIEDIIKCNVQGNNLLINDIKVIKDSSQTLFLTEILSEYKIVIYFPKMACKDCIRTMFKLVKGNPKFNTSDFLIISDFYSIGELKLYKKEFDLQDYDLFLLEKPERMESLKYPIIFSSKETRFIFLFDKTYSIVLNKFLNYYL